MAEEEPRLGAPGDPRRRAAELKQALARHVGALQDEARATRLQALAGISRAVSEPPPPAVLQEIFGQALLAPLTRCLLGDPSERCRELALELTRQGLERGTRPADALPCLLPALSQRLCLPPGPGGGGEACEELRLGLVQLLALLLRLCGGAHLAPYLPELVAALRGALLDAYPGAKREGCAAVVAAARAMPEHFHLQSESLIGPLMQNISHQHYRVRVAIIQATGAVIQFGNAKSLDDVLSHLAQRCFDDIAQVREAVIIVTGEWLLNLRDRYSYFHKLIPLLLSGLTDEMHENRELALTYWKKVGLQWEKENEEDIKDKLDFPTVPSYYPPGFTRPGLGCRELVIRNIFRILPGLCHDMTDWVEGTRIKASQLLVVLLQHAEDHTTQHMELLLRTLYRACSQEEENVVRNCIEAAKLIGAFVSPAVSLKLIISDLEKGPISSHLTILAAVVRGSPRNVLQPHLGHLASVLSHPKTSQRSEEIFYMEQLLGCVDALTEVGQEDCKEISLQLTKILVTLMAIPGSGPIHTKVEKAMNSLADVQHLDGVIGLYRQHIAQLIEWVSSTCTHWTSYSIELLQLDVIATHSGPVIGEALRAFIHILKTCLQTSREPKIRLKLFSILSELFENPNETINSQGQFGNYLEIVIKDILAPNLQWQAGRTAAAIRTTAVSCLWALIYRALLSPEEMLKVENVLLPKIIATLEEDSQMARLMSCKIISIFLEGRVKQFELSKIYPELLKRMDDSSHEVQLAAAKALGNWFRCIDDDEKKALLKANIEVLYQELLVHLDDPDQNIQSAVLDILKEGGVLYPDILAKEIEAVVHKHRTPAYCDQLLLHIESTGWSCSET